MSPYTFSSLSDKLDSTLAISWRPGKGTDHTEQASAPRLSRKRDILLAFVLVSLPLLVIAILLLAFIFLHDRERPASYTETQELPFFQNPSLDAFYSKVDQGDFLLVGSWASNVAEMVVAPFMILFSYTVAREILEHAKSEHGNADSRPPLLREIMRGGHVGVWHWIAQKTYKRPEHAPGKQPVLRVVDVAGLGLFTATLLTILVIVGDNWLHAATEEAIITHYADPTYYTENHINATDSYSYQAGFKPDPEQCGKQLNSTLPLNVSSADLPCSLNQTDNLTNVFDPSDVYLTLGTGISQISSGFNGINFTQLGEEEDKGTATPFQIVTYSPIPDVSHSFFFYPDAAREYDYSAYYGYGSRYGIDYVASTTSMVTECTFATQQCGIHTNATNSSGRNNISIPYNCYPDFSGDLGQTPSTGHERAQGWNMSFYELVNGTPTNIPVQAQSNPFHFYVATAVNSINFLDFQIQSNLAEGSPGNDSFVDAGEGFLAFALNCEATIYDLNFTIINGSFLDGGFGIRKSSPQKASIIQAPLQVGFGQYHLYEAASIAVLANNDSVAETMGKALSQTGMALASGAFDPDNNILQRYRWDVHVTRVPKAPFFYLVVLCLVYSVLGMVIAMLAIHLRRRPEVRDQQARLMVEWGPELLEMDRRTEEEERKRREEGVKKDEGPSRRSSSDIVDLFT